MPGAFSSPRLAIDALGDKLFVQKDARLRRRMQNSVLKEQSTRGTQVDLRGQFFIEES